MCNTHWFSENEWHLEFSKHKGQIWNSLQNGLREIIEYNYAEEIKLLCNKYQNPTDSGKKLYYLGLRPIESIGI